MKLLNLQIIIFILSLYVISYSCYSIDINNSTGKHYYFISLYHKSHWSFQVDLARELYNRGNRITFQLSEEFEGIENPPRELIDFATIRLVPIGYTPEDMQDICKTMSETPVSDFITLLSFFFEFCEKLSTGWVSTIKYVLDITQKGEKIDVLIGDPDPAKQGICGILSNITCIYTTPFILRYPDSEMYYLGKNTLPPWMPHNSMGLGLPSSLTNRIQQQGSKLFSQVLSYLISPIMAGEVMDYITYNNKDKSVLFNIHPTIINTFQGLDWNVPIPPFVKFIGPVNLEEIEESRDNYLLIHKDYQDKSKYLSQEELLNEFNAIDLYLEENKDIIVISFGKSVELSQENIDTILEFGRQISPIPILWTLRERHLSMIHNIPTNIRIETWVNLIGVLSHPNTNLLISQCGVASAHEGILTQTPLLCIPFLYDQFEIGVIVNYHNLGEVLDKENMTPEALKHKVNYMIPKKLQYQENSQKLIKIAKLKPSISSVVNWIELIADVGEEYFLPPVKPNHLYFFEYHELFYLSYISIFITCLLCCCCCCRSKRNNITKDKEKKE